MPQTENSTISVIVPVYNTVRFLSDCVESILNQTYTDLEVILIDDGSHDGSGAVCDAFSEKDSRVRVIHQKNGGISAARNAGLKTASGSIFAFVDSDDFLAPDFYKTVFSLMTEYDADIAMCEYATLNEGVPLPAVSAQPPAVSDEPLKFMSRVPTISVSLLMTKLFRRELFEGILFPEDKVHEDDFMITEVFFRAGRVVYTNVPYYGYIQRAGSFSHTMVPVSYQHGYESMLERAELMERHGLPKERDYWLKVVVWEISEGIKEALTGRDPGARAFLPSFRQKGRLLLRREGGDGVAPGLGHLAGVLVQEVHGAEQFEGKLLPRLPRGVRQQRLHLSGPARALRLPGVGGELRGDGADRLPLRGVQRAQVREDRVPPRAVRRDGKVVYRVKAAAVGEARVGKGGPPPAAHEHQGGAQQKSHRQRQCGDGCPDPARPRLSVSHAGSPPCPSFAGWKRGGSRQPASPTHRFPE